MILCIMRLFHTYVLAQLDLVVLGESAQLLDVTAADLEEGGRCALAPLQRWSIVSGSALLGSTVENKSAWQRLTECGQKLQ